jgi:hypothetical protein
MKARLLCGCALLLCHGALAQPVTLLPPASTPISGAEVLYIVQDGISKKISATNLLAAVPIPPPTPGGGFVFVQATPATVWIITHNLQVFPSIVVADSAGTYIEGDIFFDNLNQVTLTFAAPFAGIAYLS